MKQFLIALDQTFGTLFGGMADETISARVWRESKSSVKWEVARKVIDSLFWFDEQHCFSSYLSEFERNQLPEEYKKWH